MPFSEAASPIEAASLLSVFSAYVCSCDRSMRRIQRLPRSPSKKRLPRKESSVTIETHPPFSPKQAADKDPLIILGVLFRNRGVPGKKQFLEKNGIFVDAPLEEALETMYTIEDSIRDEARTEGIEQGRAANQRETARNMLTEGCNAAFIARMTGLTQQVIEKLKQELMPPPSATVQSDHLQPA